MSRRRNKTTSPPTSLKSRAFVTRHFSRSLKSKPWFQQQQATVQRRRQVKTNFSNLRKQIHRSPIAKKLHSLQPHAFQQVNRCHSKFSRILSWRADQKGSGKGGRQRKERSQREKAASAAKHFNNCK